MLAIAYDAVPVIAFEPAPGETLDVPALGVYDGPIGVVLGRQGGLAGPGVERALTFTLDIPEPAHRREHWRRSVPARRSHDSTRSAIAFD